MKVRMKTTARGPSFEADAGQVLEVPETLGRDLVGGGFAELVGGDSLAAKAETAAEASLASKGTGEVAAKTPRVRKPRPPRTPKV